MLRSWQNASSHPCTRRTTAHPMIDTLHTLQARISILETLVIELLASQPNAAAIVQRYAAATAQQHAQQIATGIQPGFAAAYRSAQQHLLSDLTTRLRAAPDS